jgi:hypothetical protein
MGISTQVCFYIRRLASERFSAAFHKAVFFAYFTYLAFTK